MCEAVEKVVKEENARVMINAIKNASISFEVSEEEAAEKLGYTIEEYENAKKNQGMLL